MSKTSDLSRVDISIPCQFCAGKAYVLRGAQAEPRWAGWIRYGCSGGHRFAVPEHGVVAGRRAA